MDALLREAEAIKTSLENSARFLHLMPNEAPKALNFLNQLNDKIGQVHLPFPSSPATHTHTHCPATSSR
jgi:hypothetical protein